MRVPVVYDRYSYADCVEFSLSDFNKQQLEKCKELLQSLTEIEVDNMSFSFKGKVKLLAYDEDVLVPRKEKVETARITVYKDHWCLSAYTEDGGYLESEVIYFD
jgi:hypothetical protein